MEQIKINEIDVLNTAIEKHRTDIFERKAIKECAELIKVLCGKQHMCNWKQSLATAIGKLELMLEILKLINGCGDEVKKARAEEEIILHLYNMQKE